MVKVSVIVPVYKVEKYLRRCLDSLVNQTMQEIEIIVVNDAGNMNRNTQGLLNVFIWKKMCAWAVQETVGLRWRKAAMWLLWTVMTGLIWIILKGYM